MPDLTDIPQPPISCSLDLKGRSQRIAFPYDDLIGKMKSRNYTGANSTLTIGLVSKKHKLMSNYSHLAVN
ncbi:hypothetical protein BT93_L0943 [Corymbia citriodora subsp. variegata]|uniref:Uncharacterized protein n=1 Tax=Corymbia citriodora subsp. variegata TaxID=360336 RepID=A0A8T0CXS3_CORYI|nr:hypothetical protein BT93_L0943 [Corymbia citriodora subsp. variegata]